jgi:hypothetical protein
MRRSTGSCRFLLTLHWRITRHPWPRKKGNPPARYRFAARNGGAGRPGCPGSRTAGRGEGNREDGALTVRLACADGSVRVEVSDTGIGMQLDEMKGLFQDFYRVKNPRPLPSWAAVWARPRSSGLPPNATGISASARCRSAAPLSLSPCRGPEACGLGRSRTQGIGQPGIKQRCSKFLKHKNKFG